MSMYYMYIERRPLTEDTLSKNTNHHTVIEKGVPDANNSREYKPREAIWRGVLYLQKKKKEVGKYLKEMNNLTQRTRTR